MEDEIWEIATERELKKAEAKSDSAVLPSQGLERVEPENAALLAEFGLLCHGVDIVRAVHEEATVGVGAGVVQESLFEPKIVYDVE